jgi:proteasome accessory factor C
MSVSRTAQRLNRLLAALPWLIANPGAGVNEVVERFDYDRDQLAKDLATVFVCGLPGYGPGDLMVAYIDEDEVVVEMADYFASPIRLTASEALGLLAAGRALESSGQASPALASAVDKLQRVVLPDSEEVLVVELPEPPLVAELREAAEHGSVTHIEHASVATGEVTSRDIEPWAVFSTLGNWYVSAWCRSVEAERVFRIDRIRAVTPTGESFPPNEEPPTPEVRYTPNEDDVVVTIELQPAAAWVAEHYPVEIVDTDEASLVIRMSVSDPVVAARLLLRLGDSAVLIDGQEVAAATEDLRRRILARYENLTKVTTAK